MQWILVARDEELAGLTTVTLNRPEKLNAINLRMHEELQQVCLNLKRGADTRVVIFTGAGHRILRRRRSFRSLQHRGLHDS